MKLIFVIAFFLQSCGALAGSVQSFRTTNDGNIQVNSRDGSSSLVPEYLEGSWTVTENVLINLTGTGVFTTAGWFKTGSLVHAFMTGIEGYVVTTAGDRTVIVMNHDGLPGLSDTGDNSQIAGYGFARESTSPFNGIQVQITNGGGGTIYVELDTTNVTNGDTLIL